MLTNCSKPYVRLRPPLITCDREKVPDSGTVTTKNAPELIVRLYGHIETNHKCMDSHREKGDIR